jgi:hypothetical protein
MRGEGYNVVMELTFERGEAARPAGHALLYFTTGTPERVLATYLVIPPVELNLAKYMPPMFAASLPTGVDTSRPVPLPPIPEEVPGRGYLRRLAEARGDDLVYAGSVLDDEPQRMMLETTYAAEAYSQRYEGYLSSISLEEPAAPQLDAATLLYSAMNEGERLAELTKLTGTLREATERGDLRGVAENTREMRTLVEMLSPKYRGNRLLSAAQEPGERGRRLCELLLERAYALHREEYLDVGRLDREIEALETHTPSE